MRVLNKKNLKKLEVNMVYIGRPSKWGNPFAMRSELDRERVIEQYEEHLMNSPHLINQISELKGKDLVCWCSPKACHGDVLKKIIENL
jgi:hypothetical protein